MEKLAAKIASILGLPVGVEPGEFVLVFDGNHEIRTSGDKYERWISNIIESGFGLFGFAIDRVQVKANVYELSGPTTRTAMINVNYNHSELVGNGNNGVSFRLIQVEGEWHTDKEYLALYLYQK